MSNTFELGGELNTGKIDLTINIKDQIVQKIGGDLEQVCILEQPLIKGVISNLVGLAHLSFATHRHMILDPDAVWITIEHGLATHIKENAEALRSQFVSFEGKKTIEIWRSEFVRGGINNWEGCSKYCSYCVVPYTRGEEVSRPFDDVLTSSETMHHSASSRVGSTAFGSQ